MIVHSYSLIYRRVHLKIHHEIQTVGPQESSAKLQIAPGLVSIFFQSQILEHPSTGVTHLKPKSSHMRVLPGQDLGQKEGNGIHLYRIHLRSTHKFIYTVFIIIDISYISIILKIVVPLLK